MHAALWRIWACQVYLKLQRGWPETWKYGWDPYRSISQTPSSVFKVKQQKNGTPEEERVPATAGNTWMDVMSVYRAACVRKGLIPQAFTHHQVKDDTFALKQVMEDADVRKLRWLGINDKKGVYLLADREQDVAASLFKGRGSLYYSLGPGWKEVTGPDSEFGVAKELKPSGLWHSGPTNGITVKKTTRLAECWDWHHRETTKQKIAHFSNGYAGEQAVKPAPNYKRGTRMQFIACKDTDPSARLRWRPRKAGESLVDQRKAWRASHWFLPEHVDVVLAVMARSGAKGMKSMYQAWTTFNKGSFGDDTIKKVITRDNFALLWRNLSFMDYQAHNIMTKEGIVDTSKDPLVRVQWYFDEMENCFGENWTFGQYVVCVRVYGYV